MKYKGSREAQLEARTRELLDTQERFAYLYDSSKDAMGFATLDGVLIDVNTAFCALTGYSRGEILDRRRYQDITPEEYQEYEGEIIRRITETGTPEEYEKEYVRKDGTRVPIVLTTFVVKGTNGRPIGLAAIVKDVTERKRTDEELKQYRAHLEDLVEERTVELEKANEHLRAEITRRKQAEKCM